MSKEFDPNATPDCWQYELDAEETKMQVRWDMISKNKNAEPALQKKS